MILLADLIRLPLPADPQPTPPFSEHSLRQIESRMTALADLSLRSGVINAEQAERMMNRFDYLTGTIRDLQRRLQLREGLDFSDVFDLRNRWKDGYRTFVRFRDVLRDSLNILVLNGTVEVARADAIKTEADAFFAQMMEVDRIVRVSLRS